jgi:hypothetical protein
MDEPTIIFRVHAIKRMFARGIWETDVRAVLEAGETIEETEEAGSYPTRLLLGWVLSQPLHVLAAFADAEATIIVITAYRPEPTKWYPGFRKRRPA